MKNKIIIMKTKPEITDDEIRSYMNFDKLVQQAKAGRKFDRTIRNIGMIMLGVIVISAAWYVSFRDLSADPSAAEVQPEQESAFDRTDSIDTAQGHPPKKESRSKAEQQPKPGETSVAKSTNETHETMAGDKVKVVPQGSRDSALKAPQPQAAGVYKQAEPVDGYTSLYEYFAHELRYPQEAIADSIEGVVLVAFTINTQGRPEKIIVEQSLGPAFDQEGVRVIAKMPDWRPASYNDKPVPSRISVPLTFEIKRIKAND